MRNLEWSEGMSVGVESIDNDHKTLMLLINEVNEAITNGSSDSIIEDVFNRLEGYVKQHFAREELLLKQCRYNDLDDHKKQHQKFIDRIPELKNQLLNADSVDVAQEVSLFLLNWLMNHIIVDDMSYAKTLHKYGLATGAQQESSFLKRIYSRVGKKITLDKRIFLSTLVPTSGLVILSIAILWYSFQQYSSTKRLPGLTEVVRHINTLSHSLQAERGLSTGYISSNYQDFSSELKAHRSKTDVATKAYMRTLTDLSPELMNKKMFLHLQKTEKWLARLTAQRIKIDSQLSTTEAMQEYYSRLIVSLVSIFNAMGLLEIDADLKDNITVLSAIINLKEAAGLERAFGTKALEKGRFTNDEYQKFSRLIGKQEGLLEVFEHAATSQQKAQWELLTNSEIYINASRLERLIGELSDDRHLSEIDSNYWFEVMSGKIDQLKLLIEQLVADIEVKAKGKTKQLQLTLYSIAGILLFMMLLTLLVSWLLNQSIISPVRQLTYAMARLSQGHRDVRFNDDFANDEIGKLFDAYEHSRRKLLQADISSAFRFKRQSISLEQKKREKEQYKQLASIDALTGAINRRKFIELAEMEIARVKRYQHGLSLMMLDIDHFKKINDSYGHASGDCVLKAFYQTCHDMVRNTDTVARIGGEEFVILLPETHLQQAGLLAERVRTAIKNLTVTEDETAIKLTVSIGVTSWDDGVTSVDSMLKEADEALYEAKNTGRNRVVTVQKEWPIKQNVLARGQCQ